MKNDDAREGSVVGGPSGQLFHSLGVVAAFTCLMSCSASGPEPHAEPLDWPAYAGGELALVVDCNEQTAGLPCDPDGAGPSTECEGVCWFSAEGNAACRSLSDLGREPASNNGRICGDAAGSNCARSCENGTCVDKSARLGAACRPGGTGSSCDGVCTLLGGAPDCQRVDACPDFGAAGCSLQACDFDDNTKGCVSYDLASTGSCQMSGAGGVAPGSAGAGGAAPGGSSSGPVPPQQPTEAQKVAGGACSVQQNSDGSVLWLALGGWCALLFGTRRSTRRKKRARS